MDDMAIRMEIFQPLQYEVDVYFKKLWRDSITNETVLKLTQRLPHSLEN